MLNDNDSSWVASRMQEAIGIIESAWTSPSVLLRPKIFKDGDKWCALYGDNIMEGVVAFGASPSLASLEFDREWYEKVNE